MIRSVFFRLQHIHQQPGQVRRVGGRTDLVIDHPEGIVVFPYFQHGLYEVVSIAPEHPGNADDEILLQQFLHRQFPVQLALAVYVQRCELLAVCLPELGSLAVEHIVRRDVHELGIQSLASPGQIPCPVHIHSKDLILVLRFLGSIHGRPSRTVAHTVRLDLLQHPIHCSIISNIQRHIGHGSNSILHAMILRRGTTAHGRISPFEQLQHHIMAQLSIDTRYQDFHVV